MELINLTSHAINLMDVNGTQNTIAPSGQVARCEEKRVAARNMRLQHTEFLVHQVKFGEVTGLPEPEFGKAYIVSGMVLAAVPHRKDVFAPGKLIRDESGRVISAEGLSCTPQYQQFVRDDCGYCGADNGPNGEYRNGHACCSCGSD